jgi:polyhydroxybutyrate depolymerase
MNRIIIAISTMFILPIIAFGQQTLSESILHDNIQRDYIIHIPNSYNSNVSSPLVFCFHGYGGNATNLVLYTNFNYVSDTANFIVVYPQGTLDNQATTHWNVGGWTAGSTVDDVGFISSLIDSISTQYNINQERIYSTGMSNGGYMSFLLACQLSEKIAAIASVTGSMTPGMFNACNPQHPTPILQLHGTNDLTVPYLGNPAWTVSIENVLQYWVDYNNCDNSSIITPIADISPFDGSTVERISWLNGDNSVITEHLRVIGGGHDWFGSWGNMDIHSTAEIWKFFSKYDINGLIGSSTEIGDIRIKDKKLLKLIDLLGREIKEKTNEPLFYIYDDGTVEKRITID